MLRLSAMAWTYPSRGAARPHPTSFVHGAALRRELDLPDGAPIVLTVGRLASQKGHLDLLDAIGRLSDSCGNVHYVWAGEGEKETSLRAAIGAAGLDGWVHLLGFRRDVAALLHAADLFVMPTRWEAARAPSWRHERRPAHRRVRRQQQPRAPSSPGATACCIRSATAPDWPKPSRTR
jgi:hypothetical protein